MAWLLEHPEDCLSDSPSLSSFDALSDKDSLSDEVTSCTEEVCYYVCLLIYSIELLRTLDLMRIPMSSKVVQLNLD